MINKIIREILYKLNIYKFYLQSTFIYDNSKYRVIFKRKFNFNTDDEHLKSLIEKSNKI